MDKGILARYTNSRGKHNGVAAVRYKSDPAAASSICSEKVGHPATAARPKKESGRAQNPVEIRLKLRRKWCAAWKCDKPRRDAGQNVVQGPKMQIKMARGA